MKRQITILLALSVLVSLLMFPARRVNAAKVRSVAIHITATGSRQRVTTTSTRVATFRVQLASDAAGPVAYVASLNAAGTVPADPLSSTNCVFDLRPGGVNGPPTIQGASGVAGTYDLSEWYVQSTSGDKLHIYYNVIVPG